MTLVSWMATYAFRQAWMACGQPTMLVVRPIASWTLPSGYVYDASVDALVDAAGAVVTDPSPYWVTDTINLVPADVLSDLVQMMPGGTVPDGSVAVCVLGVDAETLRAAQRVQLSGDWYNVTDVGGEPAGAVPAGWAVVRLQRRR